MKHGLARAGSGATLFVAAVMLVLALGMPGTGALESKNDAWAVIFATPEGSDNGPISEGQTLHDWLLDHGWLHSHIRFLAGTGSADATPTKENLQSALAEVAVNSNSGSLVFIAVMNHGHIVESEVYFNAANGPVSKMELGSWVNGISSYKKMVVEVSFGYSGGFLPGLSGPNRLLLSSHTSAQGGSPNRFLLSEGLGSSPTDLNCDGYVSVQEAYINQCQKLGMQYPTTQTPQISDNTGPVILTVS